MVALQMHQEGLIDLDGPARNANPAWRTSDTFASASITPRDMMSHRTGLPRHDQITFAGENNQINYLRADNVSITCSGTLMGSPDLPWKGTTSSVSPLPLSSTA